MWQFLLAAAVAGSGFLAKRLFSDGDHKNCCEFEQIVTNEEREGVDSVKVPNGSDEVSDFKSTLSENLKICEEGIFRFSSLGSGDGSGCSMGLMKKKSGLKGNLVGGGKRRNKIGRVQKKSSSLEEQRKIGRKFCFCLKRRRTCKNAFGKCGSCLSQGSSCSNLGLSFALMCMVSSGKAEINKLSVVVDETTKFVNDLRSKLNKRKLSSGLQELSCKTGDCRCHKETVGKNKEQLITTLAAIGENSLESKVLGPQPTDDCEHASSVLTEESEPELLEMEELEAELESELQKISCWTSEEPSSLQRTKSNLSKIDRGYSGDVPNAVVIDGGAPDLNEKVGANGDSYGFHGVSPSELDRKLCHLLIEQQETQILELESKLHWAHTKLHDKDAELEALKTCVRHLRDLSLETAADEAEETAPNVVQEGNCYVDFSMSTRSDDDALDNKVHSERKVAAEMKRIIKYEL